LSSILKRVRYEGIQPNNPLNLVVYCRYGRQIVFSGLHNSNEGRVRSTINGAEQVIIAIALAERIDPRDFEFFDLQTQRGYASFRPGDYEFSQLSPTWQGAVPIGMQWQGGYCSKRVLDDFRRYIGYSDSIPPRNRAVAAGALSPLPESDQPWTFGDIVDVSIAVETICNNLHLPEIGSAYLERVVTVCELLCQETSVDSRPNHEQLSCLSKATPLGTNSAAAFEQLLEWVTRQHPEFGRYIQPVAREEPAPP